MPNHPHRHTIVFSNQKGGVGKTTLTREIGIYLASAGTKTLLVDIDPQANLSRSLADNLDNGLFEALTGGGYEAREIFPSLYLLCGNIRLASLEKSLIGELDAYIRLREFMAEPIFQEFEYILIDSPPSLGVLTINALTAADHLVIPMNPALYSLQGTNDLMGTIAKVKKNLNPNLSIAGVIINAFDQVPVITREIRQEIVSSFGDRVFRTVLSKSIKIEEAIAGRHGVVTLTKAKVKDEVVQIGEELIDRLEGVR